MMLDDHKNETQLRLKDCTVVKRIETVKVLKPFFSTGHTTFNT